MAGVIQIVPVGSTARTLVREIAEPLSAELSVQVVFGQPLTEPSYAFNKDRSQYHSSAILRRLAPLRSKAQLGVLGIAEVDLFIPDHPFVFGEADREGKVAIISLARLRPEFQGAPQNTDLLRSRARSEAVHEAGHLAGLSHCHDLHCVMFFSSSVFDTDKKGFALCHDCKAELARLHERGG